MLLFIWIHAECQIRYVADVILIQGKCKNHQDLQIFELQDVEGNTVEVTNLQHPLQVLVVVRIYSLYVVIGHLHTKYVLVEGPSEINIQQLPIK